MSQVASYHQPCSSKAVAAGADDVADGGVAAVDVDDVAAVADVGDPTSR